MKATPLFSFDPGRILTEYLSAEQYRTCCGTVWSADRRAGLGTPPRLPKQGGIIYAKADHYIPLFHLLRRSLSRVVLVTAESDITITEEIHAMAPLQVGAWFSTNAGAPGVHALPLGLGNSYCQVTPKAETLAAFQGASRRRLLYVNFRSETNPAVRQPVMEHFLAQGADWLTVRNAGVSRGDFLGEMTAHRFVLCPPGNGLDTHRIWEALYGKTIPIVLRHPALEAFEDLPILFVDDFRIITREFLERAAREMQEKLWNQEKLFLPWWRKTFEAAAAALVPSRISAISLVARAIRSLLLRN